MKTSKIFELAIGSLVAMTLLPQAAAQQGGMGRGGMGQATTGQPAMTSQPSNGMADGVVRKVDKDAGKLTIKHGPIPSMDMPPMTMVYRVSDPTMLDQVKPGDAIRFTMDKVSGQYTVTRIGAGK